MKLPSLKLESPALKRAAAAALVLAAIAGVVAGREKPALEVVQSKPAPAVQASAPDDLDLGRLAPSRSSAPQGDPFAPRSFAPPPAPRAEAQAAPRSAPPVPFRYVGKLVANGKTEIFLMRGEELISIAAGQDIDGEYRVDAITEERIALTYLPLKARQSIELAEANG